MTDCPDCAHFRRLLFQTHPCHGVYGDDGEMQCGSCLIDFKRDAPEDIERKTISGLLKKVGMGR